jgi:hypothetical protein
VKWTFLLPASRTTEVIASAPVTVKDCWAVMAALSLLLPA